MPPSHPGKPLTPIEAAIPPLLQSLPQMLEVEAVPMEQALGRIVGSDVAAPINVPPHANSAMDGYALRAADSQGARGLVQVSQRIAAGQVGEPLQAGTAARIFTGAPLPPGADAVVMQEQVSRDGDTISLKNAPRLGQNIRRRGEDVADGAKALSAGLTLSPPRLALLAGCGVASVAVRPLLRVAILSTGDELSEPGHDLGPGQIYNSNRVLLWATLSRLPWVDLTDLGILPDDPASIRVAIRHAAQTHDVVISSGGVSAGEEDHVLDALRFEAAELEVLKVAIRPGKPLTVGRLGRALYFGLPGNPYAAVITFTQIARPALRRAAGLIEEPDSWLPAVVGFTYSRSTGRREYVPVSWSERDPFGRPILTRLGQGASASMSPMAQAMGIAVIPPELEVVGPNQPIQVEPLVD